MNVNLTPDLEERIRQQIASGSYHDVNAVIGEALRLPLSGSSVEMKRKSQTFWKLLGDQNIGSTILRVPITFPPEKFNGRERAVGHLAEPPRGRASS